MLLVAGVSAPIPATAGWVPSRFSLYTTCLDADWGRSETKVASPTNLRDWDRIMTEPSEHKPKRAPLGWGGWAAIVAMGVLLGASIWFAFYGWNLTDAVIDTPGII